MGQGCCSRLKTRSPDMSPPMAVKVGLIPDEAVDHVEGALRCLAEPRAFGERTEELGVGARRVEREPPGALA